MNVRNTTFGLSRLRATIGCAAALLAVQVAAAEIPRVISFQGKLPGAGAGPVDMTIRLWADKTSIDPADLLFEENNANVSLADEVFSVKIGGPSGGLPVSALDSPTGEVWLALAIDGGAEMTPRTRLVTVPFAFAAHGAERLVIPDTHTQIVTVDSAGAVYVSDKIKLQEDTDGGALLTMTNADDMQTVKIDGAETVGAGRLTLWNGDTTNNVSTVRLDGDAEASGGGQLYLYDANNYDAIRLHADRHNDAPEISMWMGGDNGATRETVQLTANSEGGDQDTGGSLVLRHVNDPAETAVKTVELRASSESLTGDMNSGGYLELSHSDGTPVFTVQAGSLGALFPTFMEMRAATGDRRIYVSPVAFDMYDSNNTRTINLNSTSSEFTGDLEVGGDMLVGGETTTGVLTITGGSDLSEQFDIRANGGAVEPGMVVSIDPGNPGKLVVSDSAYDRTVAGVISGAGGVNTGMVMSQTGSIADGQHPVALTGRVWVHCDASDSAIAPGDLLTTSATPGHAMRVSDHNRAQGAVIGKAMTALDAGERGLVLVLVNLQ